MTKETEAIIKVENVSKVFKVPHEKLSTVKQHFVNIFNPKSYEKFRALDGVALEVKKGEFFGIIGSNGSGKSTMLKILAGIYQPTSGQVAINGSLSPFIELGVGFNPELTARDNIFLNAAILGLSKKQTEEKFDEIIDFAELREFLDQKLKNFSSGMQVRLAFSIAIQAEADILLVDEVLAVGDASFQQKCLEVFQTLKREGRTIIFVSHDLETMLNFCDRIALINYGKLSSIGVPKKVINDYINWNTDKEIKSMERREIEKNNNSSNRWGDGKARIIEVRVGDNSDDRKKYYGEELMRVSTKVVFNESCSNPIFGIIVKNQNKISIFESNTLWKKIVTGSFKKGDEVLVTWVIKNCFSNGEYTVSPAVAYSDGKRFYDWREEASSFLVKKDSKARGIIDISHDILIN